MEAYVLLSGAMVALKQTKTKHKNLVVSKHIGTSAVLGGKPKCTALYIGSTDLK